MIIAQPRSTFPAALLIAALAGLSVLAVANLPKQQAEAEQIRSVTRREEDLHRIQLPVYEAQAAAKAAKVQAEGEQQAARIRNATWLEGQQVQLSLHMEQAWAQFSLVLAYGGSGAVLVLIGWVVVARTLRSVELKRRDPWEDPAFRVHMREMARAREQAGLQAQAPRPVPVAERVNGHNHPAGKVPEAPPVLQ